MIFIAGVIFFVRSAPPTELTISSGPEGSSFHRTANRYVKALAGSGVKVNVITSNGSLQNLQRLSEPNSNVDLALVQSGIVEDAAELSKVVSLGVISNQPIFFFYRGPAIDLLSQAQGKQIAIGLQGSGARKIALKLLKLNGIDAEKSAGL